MAGHSGQFYVLGIGKQTSKGTPQTTPKFRMRLTGGSVVPDVQTLDLPETDSSIQRSKAVKVGQLVGGAVEGFVRSDEIGLLALGALGTEGVSGAGPYVHTASASGTPPYFTLYSVYDTTALVDQYVDCRIQELTIRGGGGQAITYSASFQGITANFGQADPGSPAPSTVDPMVYPLVTVTLGGVTTDIVESFEITSTKNIAVVQGDTGMAPSAVELGRWSVSGTMTILFESDAKWRAWTTGSPTGTVTSPTLFTEALTIGCVRTAGSDEVNLTLTAVELRQVALQPDPGGDPLRFTYTFSAQPQATIANTYSIVSKNQIATY